MTQNNKLIDVLQTEIGKVSFSDNPYNKDFDYFDFHKGRFSYLLKRSKEFFKVDDKCLDVGSLFGYLSLGEKIIGYKVFGVDLPKYVNQFKDNFNNWHIDNRPADLTQDNLPFENDYFDLIIASEILEHLRFHPRTFFAELARVLKPGGRILLTTPNLVRFNNVVKIIFGKSINWDINDDYWDGVHFREFTYNEIKNIADKAGLKVVENSYRNFTYPNMSLFVRIINKIIGFIFPSIRGNLIIVLSK